MAPLNTTFALSGVMHILLHTISSVSFSVLRDLATWLFHQADLNMRLKFKTQMGSWIIKKLMKICLSFSAESTNTETSPVALQNKKNVNKLKSITCWIIQHKEMLFELGTGNWTLWFYTGCMPRSLLRWDEFFGNQLGKGGKADYFYWILLLCSCGWEDSSTPLLCYCTVVLDGSSHRGFVLK